MAERLPAHRQGSGSPQAAPVPEPVMPEQAQARPAPEPAKLDREARLEALLAADMWPDPERQAAARVTLAQLKQRLASPHLSPFMLPGDGSIATPPMATAACLSCGKAQSNESRAGHATEALAKGRERCALWALGLPWSPKLGRPS